MQLFQIRRCGFTGLPPQCNQFSVSKKYQVVRTKFTDSWHAKPGKTILGTPTPPSRPQEKLFSQPKIATIGRTVQDSTFYWTAISNGNSKGCKDVMHVLTIQTYTYEDDKKKKKKPSEHPTTPENNWSSLKIAHSQWTTQMRWTLVRIEFHLDISKTTHTRVIVNMDRTSDSV